MLLMIGFFVLPAYDVVVVGVHNTEYEVGGDSGHSVLRPVKQTDTGTSVMSTQETKRAGGTTSSSVTPRASGVNIDDDILPSPRASGISAVSIQPSERASEVSYSDKASARKLEVMEWIKLSQSLVLIY
jgi:hypothetical protein